MAARVRYRPEFIEDFDRHRDFLVRQTAFSPEERLRRLDDLYSAIGQVERQLSRFPARGTPLRQDDRYVLRHWPLPGGLPYLVQYIHRRGRPVKDVWLARLWHYSQQRAEPDLSDWPA